jgi:predicted GH43/DUF377 family glycosyl hydrolase
MQSLPVERKRVRFAGDPSHVIAKFFCPGGNDRMHNIVRRIMALDEEECSITLGGVMLDFSSRHRDLEAIVLHNYSRVKTFVEDESSLSEERKRLLGACFTQEYSIESAALFNPSIVSHPDQGGLAASCLRFIMGFRATGEGHISSIVFRSGIIDRRNTMIPDPAPPYQEIASQVCLCGDEGYTVTFSRDTLLSERVLYPVLKEERNGIEDARFVPFIDDRGSVTFYATYTAYDGHAVIPMLLATEDFITFTMRKLWGSAAQGKGMALFPEKLNGRYVMVSRQDGENLFLMESDDLYFWDDKRLLKRPEFGWEIVQTGNCGSPLKTEKGWLLLTHGVGPLRKYCIGAIMLDLEDPSKVLGQLREPLIVPDRYEREGYVPNVVYTCGALIHNGELVIPYAYSDSSSGFITVKLEALLQALDAQK